MVRVLIFLTFILTAPIQSQNATLAGKVTTKDGTSAFVPVFALPVSQSNDTEPSPAVLGYNFPEGYQLDNLPPGRYYIGAGLIDLPTYYPGTASKTDATVVSVAPGEKVKGINFVMPEASANAQEAVRN